jgi:hypothetical protein
MSPRLTKLFLVVHDERSKRVTHDCSQFGIHKNSQKRILVSPKYIVQMVHFHGMTDISDKSGRNPVKLEKLWWSFPIRVYVQVR